MGRRAVVVALVVLLTAAVPSTTSGAEPVAGGTDQAIRVGPAPLQVEQMPEDGMPPGVPPAARRSEPRLPAADGWPFAERRFSRTSGTARVWENAWYWTDFLYDDNGAVSGPGVGESPGAWPFGTYRYPDPEQAGNGADVFRAAIGRGDRFTWWRVDWNTLLDPTVPAAAFAIDLDNSGGDAADWGGNVGVRSSGIDTTLVLTAAGAYLDGTKVAPTTVDRKARSFVARVPRSALNPRGTSRVGLAAGLANAGGTAFAALGPEHQHLPGQPNVFNLGFRDYGDEPASLNFWFEQSQATALAAPAADVSRFTRRIDWRELNRGETHQRQPRRRGWSNRWYVSSIELGQGRIKPLQTSVDNKPNYPGRVQPYGVYVPKSYRADRPAPLTWLLHSLTINHNQYSATMPTLMRLACEERGSICATTLGRGPDGYYRGPAALDFWEVWRTLNETYRLDPDRTILGGYSMGGFGTFNFALDHPEAFAGMVILAAAANEDVPRLENARWLPYYHAHGVGDQLVPYTEEALPTIAELDRLGHRYRFDTYPTKDHIAWSLEDGQQFAGRWIAARDRTRRRNPGAFSYEWFPGEVNWRLGTGARGAWWVRRVRARDPKATSARIRAVSLARPEAPVTAVRSTEQLVDPSGAPVEREQLRWRRGRAPAPESRVRLRLRNVRTLRLRTGDTGLLRYRRSTIRVTSDGLATVALRELPAGARVFVNGRRTDRLVQVRNGTSVIRIERHTE